MTPRSFFGCAGCDDELMGVGRWTLDAACEHMKISQSRHKTNTKPTQKKQWIDRIMLTLVASATGKALRSTRAADVMSWAFMIESVVIVMLCVSFFWF